MLAETANPSKHVFRDRHGRNFRAKKILWAASGNLHTHATGHICFCMQQQLKHLFWHVHTITTKKMPGMCVDCTCCSAAWPMAENKQFLRARSRVDLVAVAHG